MEQQLNHNNNKDSHNLKKEERRNAFFYVVSIGTDPILKGIYTLYHYNYTDANGNGVIFPGEFFLFLFCFL